MSQLQKLSPRQRWCVLTAASAAGSIILQQLQWLQPVWQLCTLSVSRCAIALAVAFAWRPGYVIMLQ